MRPPLRACTSTTLVSESPLARAVLIKSWFKTSNIPPLVNLAQYAAYAVPRVIVGSILSPARSPHPETGRTSNQIPKINVRSGPNIMEGTQMPIIAVVMGM